VVSTKTRNLILNVRAEGGDVYVSGILAHPELETEIVRIVESIDGVKKVVANFESPPIEYMYP
jgi:osmotically-inducible protein OsmY